MSIPIEKIKYGTKVVVTDIGQKDAAYVFGKSFSGQLGTISRHKNPSFSPIGLGDNGWFYCTILFEDKPLEFVNPFYFRAVKFRLATDEEIALAERKKAEPKAPELSCTELEFLVVLESARKWFMLRERPEWTNEDYFERFPKDPKLHTISPAYSSASDCSCCSLWSKKCGDGITDCPLDKKGPWCKSGYRVGKKHYSGKNSPWNDWVESRNRCGAADKTYQAMIDWLVCSSGSPIYRPAQFR